MVETTTGMMDVALFITGLIAHRHGQTEASKIVSKCDIEGYEYTLLPKLVETTAICHLDFFYIEFHDRFIKDKTRPSNAELFTTLKWFTKQSPNCGVELSNMEDESYGMDGDKIPFPTKSTRLFDKIRRYLRH